MTDEDIESNKPLIAALVIDYVDETEETDMN
jgi:hypothetical protein